MFLILATPQCDVDDTIGIVRVLGLCNVAKRTACAFAQVCTAIVRILNIDIDIAEKL
jgi:hypothetical protein